MKLTTRGVAAARYEGKTRKLFDGNGLYLHIRAESRTWRYSFRLGESGPRDFTIGSAELYTLAEARELHRDAQKLVAAGRDPVEARRARKQAEELARIEAARRVPTVSS